MVGWFNPVVGEVYEMLYQNSLPVRFVEVCEDVRVCGNAVRGGNPCHSGIVPRRAVKKPGGSIGAWAAMGFRVGCDGSKRGKIFGFRLGGKRNRTL